MSVIYPVAYPTSVPTRDVHIEIVTQYGTGELRFTWPALYDGSGNLILASNTVVVKLAAGVETAELPCTDTATITPLNWGYLIELQVAGMPTSGTMSLPENATTAEFVDIFVPATTPNPGSADYATQAELDAEIAARQAADLTLQANITAEAAARAAADTTLQTNITALQTYVDATFATLAQLAAVTAQVGVLTAAVTDLSNRVLAIEGGTAFLGGLQVANGNGTFSNSIVTIQDFNTGISNNINPTAGTATLGGRNNIGTITFAGMMPVPGAPASGAWTAGQLVVDSDVVWWLCTVSGTPGTWIS